MGLLQYLSVYLMPLLIFYFIGLGLIQRLPIYDLFVSGAQKGLRTVVQLCPTMVGLMVGVEVLRASGFLDFLSSLLETPAQWIAFPAPCIPMTLVRMFSSSAAVGLTLDLFEQYGPDSPVGYTASLMMSCTETIFYTMSVYYMAAGVKKTRWTLAGALLATAAGLAASVLLGR